MLAAAQVNVPDELKQYLEVIPETTESLPVEDFTHIKDSTPLVKHLYYPSGKPVNHRVVYHENELIVIDNVGRRTKYSFPTGSIIVDIDLLVKEDGTFGLMVNYNYHTSSYLARLVKAQTGFNCVHECILPYQGICVKTIIDDIDMPKFRPYLSKQMQNWQNAVVVGTQYGHAYVLYLPVNNDWTNDTKPVVRRMTDALDSYHREMLKNGNSQKVFLYRLEGRADIIKAPIDVYVTAMTFIARSCDLLIGLSFGGIIQIGFTPGGDISSNVFQSSSPVCKLIPMLAHDDPQSNVWFWSFHGERGRGLFMTLYEGSYRSAVDEGNVLNEREFRKPRFIPRYGDAPAEKGTNAEWIACSCLIRERRSEDRNEETISRTSNTFYENEFDTSQMFFSYNDANGIFRCGLFDLNTYYFKRLPERPYIDGTRAKQCPFITNLVCNSLNDLEALGEIQDVYIDTTSISRFQFVSEDPDQQIYASGININKIQIEGSFASLTAKIESLPSKILNYIYKNLSRHIKNPQEASSFLVAAGLMTAPLDLDWTRSSSSSITQLGMLSGFTSYELLVTGAIYYEYPEAISEIIEKTKDEEWPSLKTISELLWTEAQKARQKLEALYDVFCSETAMDLSIEQKKHLKQICLVFNGTKTIYQALHSRFNRLKGEEINPKTIIAENEARISAVSNLADHITCLRNLYKARFIPLGERDAEERHVLEKAVNDRRKKLREMTPPKSLLADKLVERMKRISPDQDFWLDQTAVEWYPPAIMNGVAPLIVLDISQNVKQQYIIYYLIDIVMARRRQEPFLDVYAAREVSWTVTEMLTDVLNIKHADVTQILNIWKEEHNDIVPIKKLEAIENIVPHDIYKKIDRLISKKLSPREENELKELCSCVNYGKYSYQLYLIRNLRLTEVELLPKSDINNEHVKKYDELLMAIRKLKEEAQSFDVAASLPTKWSDNVITKLKFDDIEPHESESAISSKPLSSLFGQTKTPRPLYNKIRKLTKDVEPVLPKEEIQLEKLSSPERSQQQSELEVTPKLNELDERTRETINNILRTPTSRRARAAAAAEGQTGVEVTPETQPLIPAPTSILKTPIRKISTMSPGRGRLRWDPEFVEPSLDSSQLAVASEENKPIAIHFSNEDSTMEEQSDNDEFEDTVEVLNDENKIEERQISAGTDDTVQIFEEQPEETEAFEEETAEIIQEIVNVNIKKWIDEDGLEHSFEQQVEEDEVKAEDDNVEEAVSDSTFVIERPQESHTEIIVPFVEEIRLTQHVKIQQNGEENESGDAFTIDVEKYKRKSVVPKPRLSRKMMSEEPEPIRLPSEKRTLSSSPVKEVESTRPSAVRALFKEESNASQLTESLLRRSSRSRTPAQALKVEVIPKATPRRTHTASTTSQKTEEIAKEDVAKSPSKSTHSTTVKVPEVVEEVNEAEEDDDFIMDTEKFRVKGVILKKPPVAPKKMMSEEPEPIKPKRLRRTISETLVPEDQVKTSSLRSTSRSKKEKSPTSSQLVETSIRRSSRSRTPAKALVEEISKATPKRKRAASQKVEEIVTKEVPKSPARRARSVSRPVEEPKEETVPKSASKRARTRTPSVSAGVSEEQERKRPPRGAQTPKKETIVEENEEPTSPAKKRPSRRREKSPEPETSTNVRTAKSPARRGRPPKADDGKTVIETFRALVEAKRKPTKKMSGSTVEPTPKKANTVDPKEMIEAKVTRSSSRLRSASTSGDSKQK